MGVTGLTKYVEENLPFDNADVWETFDLRDTKVIIDGCGLYFYIYGSVGRLDCKYGGQYNKLQKKLKKFFTKLRSNNVEPYVVFDGIMAKDEKKFDTLKEREKNRIKQMKKLWTSADPHQWKMVLPQLVEITVVQVLQEIEVPYARADFEADCEIASLANELEAPVMANDGDFYIFNVKHGYIPFQQYEFFTRNTTVKKFSQKGFAKHLGIDSILLPVLASLIGNDYITNKMSRNFADHMEKLTSTSQQDPGCKVSTTAQFLSKHHSVSDAIHDATGLYSNKKNSAFERKLRLSIEEYQIKQSNLIDYFVSGDLSCNMRTYNGHLLPEWIIKLYRQGFIASEGLSHLCNKKVFLRTQCEDISLPSAHLCAQDLRWYYYALALKCENAGTLEPTTTEPPSQSQAGLETDFYQTLSRGLSPGSQVDMEIKGCVDQTLSQPEGTFSKGGKPSMISVKTEQGTDNDHDLAEQPLVAASEFQKQSKDSSLNMTTAQADSEATFYSDMSISVATQVHDSENSFELEFADVLNFKETSINNTEIVPSSSYYDGKTDDTLQATSNVSKNPDTAEDIMTTEFEREGSTLVPREVDLTQKVFDIEIQIHDIPKMSDQAKKTHLLSLLHSDLSFIHDLPMKHQLVASALRYWVIHANVKPAHLAALLVHYLGEKQNVTGGMSFQVTIEAVHGFSEWQNVLYWVQRLNALFSSSFEQLQVTKLYDGNHVCKLYERLRITDVKAEDLVVDSEKNVYLKLRDAITKDLPPAWQLIQSQRKKKQQSKQDGKSKPEKKTNPYEHLPDENN